MLCPNCRQPMKPVVILEGFDDPWSLFLCRCGADHETRTRTWRMPVLNAVRRRHPADYDARTADSANDAGNWWLWPVLVVSLGLLVIGACHRIIGG